MPERELRSRQSSIALPARFGIPRDAVSCIRLILVAVAAVTFRVGQAPVTVSAVGALRPADAPDLLVPTMLPGFRLLETIGETIGRGIRCKCTGYGLGGPRLWVEHFSGSQVSLLAQAGSNAYDIPLGHEHSRQNDR